MPTVLEVDGFLVRMHAPPREHPPPHVHVVKGSGRAVIRLGSARRPPRVWKVYDMKAGEVVRAFRIVEAHQDFLLSKWEQLHGTPPNQR